ncbi:hypothetical protein [Rhizobium binxianense]
MKSFILIGTMLITVVSLTACETTSADGVKHTSVKKTVAAGQRTKLAGAWQVKPDCSADPAPQIRLLEPPKHGNVDIVHEPVFTNPKRPPKCGSKKVQGTAVYYTGNTGYAGSDKFVTRSSFSVGGHVEDTTVNMTVVK